MLKIFENRHKEACKVVFFSRLDYYEHIGLLDSTRVRMEKELITARLKELD